MYSYIFGITGYSEISHLIHQSTVWLFHTSRNSDITPSTVAWSEYIFKTCDMLVLTQKEISLF